MVNQKFSQDSKPVKFTLDDLRDFEACTPSLIIKNKSMKGFAKDAKSSLKSK